MTSSKLPGMKKISDYLFRDETSLIRSLAAQAELDGEAGEQT